MEHLASPPPASPPIESVSRALDVLEALAQAQKPLLFSELVDVLKWPKSSVHRMLATLVQRGFVERAATDATYRLGRKLWGLGYRALANDDLIATARPHLRRLVDLAQESANLAVLLPDAASSMYVDRIDGPKAVHVNSPVGLVTPSWCTATGRSMLAHRPGAWDRVLSGRLEKLTPYTVTDPRQLRSILKKIAIDGFAVARAERGIDHGGVAAPIRDHSGEAVASCGVALPVFRMTRALVDRWVPIVVATAEEISTALGWQSGSSRAPGTAAGSPG